MRKLILGCFLILLNVVCQSQTTSKIAYLDNGDVQLMVNGQPFMINGMNWDYVPIGYDVVNAGFWDKPDDIIKSALDAEMALLQNMNVNAIRQYTPVPAKWIKYMYEEYGVYTMLNHSFGRYGLIIDGIWTPVTDYSDPRTQEILLEEVTTMARDYKDVPGILFWMLGNENNYGLFWQGAETEDFPDDDAQKAFIGETRGRPMYRLMNEAAKRIKAIDDSHSVGICNGDALFIDIVAEECKDVDIFGANTYRGATFTDLFDTVKNKLNKAFVLTEFGADAYNAIEDQEDQYSQAYYMLENWKDIYQNAANLGRAGNSIGGFTFQFSDGWWKVGFDDREGTEEHSTEATWANGGYSRDLAPGANNMNEEWFGICAKGPTNSRGLYTLYPRAAYYALQEAHRLNPYTPGMSMATLNSHMESINLMNSVLRARGDKAIATSGGKGKLIELSNMRAEFETFNTGGQLLTTPNNADPNSNVYPDQLGFDHMQSFFIGVEANPSTKVKAEVNFNILGNVAANPIDQLFYENRGLPVEVDGDDGRVRLNDNERIRLYNADVEWKTGIGDLHYFNRTGHYHWGYEGDFFGLYPEANYGPNLDIYQGEISGVEFEGHGALKDFTAAFGPQLWWGANPAFLVKYQKSINKLGEVTGIFHEDLEQQSDILTSNAIPTPKTRRATLGLEREFGKLGIHVGGIWAGEPLLDRRFQFVEGTGPGNYVIYNDEINKEDNWGGKAKITYTGGKFNAYALASSRGLVANGGYDQTLTFTGWKLKDNGSGNQNNFLAGATFQTGDFQIAPNFMWQKPLVDAVPIDAVISNPGVARLRNILDDPFSVRANRETVAGEILLTFDPTPASYFYQWDNDRAEDAPFAANLGFVYRHHPTTMDSAIGFFDVSRDPLAIGAPEVAEDLWEVNSRIVSKVNRDLGLIANLYTGNAQANGSTPGDERLINRTGGDVRLAYKKLFVQGMAKFNDWGPYDYHRDFNLTYPTQLMADFSYNVDKPDWFLLPNSKFGVRGTWRSLDEHSPRYWPASDDSGVSPIGFDNGQEWEIRTYLHINIGK